MRALRVIFAALAGVFAAASPAAASVALQPIGRFSSPTFVTAPPGDASRLFVVQRRGVIRVVKRGRILRRPFLDLRRNTLVKGSSGGGDDQRGMLSMAFAPDYSRTGRFYVFYVDRRDRIRVDEVRRAPGTGDRAQASARRAVLTIPDAGPLHHGGGLAFGPDGLLYVGIGFGEDARTAQDPASPRGKILRLDPQTPSPSPEVFAVGLRNPYRFSIDRGTMYVADVGGDDVEEMTRLPVGGLPGANLGWDVFEGAERLRAGEPAGYVGPTITHRHGPEWCSIVGGFVARDRRLPAGVRGRYVYGDVCNGRVLAARPDGTGIRRLPVRVPYLVSFGQDALRRLYAVSLSGGVWRIVPARS